MFSRYIAKTKILANQTKVYPDQSRHPNNPNIKHYPQSKTLKPIEPILKHAFKCDLQGIQYDW